MADDEARARIAALEQRVRWLEHGLQQAHIQLAQQAAERQAAPSGWLPVAEPRPASPAQAAPPAAGPRPEATVPLAYAGHAHQAAPPPAAEATFAPWTGPPSGASAQPARSSRATVERLLGGNWLARVGVLVLALGVLFFLKLAWDLGWVSLPWRIAIGVAGGLAVFATGEVLRARRFDPTYSQILAGGGALITYGTLYAAYALPAYRAALHLGLATEIVLLAAAAAGLAAYAVWRNLPVLAGVAIGLCAILVAPVGEFSAAGVVFMGALGSAMLAAAAWRRWDAILLTGVLTLNLAHLAAAVAAALGLVDWWWVAASAVAVDALAVAAAARSTGLRGLALGAAAVASVGLWLCLAVAFDAAARIRDPLAWSLLAVGCASLASVGLRRVAPAVAACGAVMLLAWPFAHFDGLWVPAALEALAAAAFAVALALQRPATGPADGHAARFAPAPGAAAWLRAGAAAALALAAWSLLGHEAARELADGAAWASAGLALAAVGLGTGLWASDRHKSKPGVAGAVAAAATLALWPIAAFPTGPLQVVVHLVAAGALLVAAVAAPWRSKALHAAACGLAALGTVSLLVRMGLGATGGLADAEAAALGLAALVASTVAWLLGRRPTDASHGTDALRGPQASHGTRAAPGSQGAGHVGQASALLLAAAWPLLRFPDTLAQPTVYVAVSAVALAAAAWMPARSGLRREASAIALVFAAGTVVSFWVLGAAFGRADAEPVWAGALAAAVSGICAAGWAVAGRVWADGPLPQSHAGHRGARLAAAVVGLASPIVATGLVFEGWGIAVAWGLLALALAAAGVALRERDVRLVALAAFGLVVGRIFLVDLANLSLASRVIAFLVTGVVLLLGAYLFARQRLPAADAPQP